MRVTPGLCCLPFLLPTGWRTAAILDPNAEARQFELLRMTEQQAKRILVIASLEAAYQSRAAYLWNIYTREEQQTLILFKPCFIWGFLF